MCSSLGTLGLLQLQLKIEVVVLQLLMLVLEVLHHRRLLLILPLQGLQQAACHTQWSAAGPATQHRLHTMASHQRPPTETRSAGCLDMACSRLRLQMYDTRGGEVSQSPATWGSFLKAAASRLPQVRRLTELLTHLTVLVGEILPAGEQLP